METKTLRIESVEPKRVPDAAKMELPLPPDGVRREIAAAIEEYRLEIERIRRLHGRKVRGSILS